MLHYCLCIYELQAIAYYETAIKNGQNHLQFELVDLLLKLKQYPKAERVLMHVSLWFTTCKLVLNARCSVFPAGCNEQMFFPKPCKNFGTYSCCCF